MCVWFCTFLSFILETVYNILFINLMLFQHGFYFILAKEQVRKQRQKLHGTPAEIIIIKKKKVFPKSG